MPLLRALAAALALFVLMPTMSVRAQDAVRLYAAGSLRLALTEIGAAFHSETGVVVAGTYGASGLLRQRIEAGEPAEVFASADTANPIALMKAGLAGPVVVFARNRLCALARGGLAVSPADLLNVMLDPTVKLGTSTPKSDPSGDYAWRLFAKAETLHPGARIVLEAKALKLVGGPDSPAPPPDRSLYAQMLADGRADLFLTYCTNAQQAVRELPSLHAVAIPEALAVGADYGLTLLSGAGAPAARFAMYILSPAGQEILARHGFTAMTLPAPAN